MSLFFSFIPLVVAIAVVVHRIRTCFVAVAVIVDIHLLCPRTSVGSILVSLCPCPLPKFYLYLYNTAQNLIPLLPIPSCPFLCVFFFFFPLLSPPQTPYTPLNSNNAALFGCSCFPCLSYIATHPTHSHIHSRSYYVPIIIRVSFLL